MGPPGSESMQQARARFLASVHDVRPRLHRFCARMCGSAMDGEDLVQETLAQAFYYLSSLKDESRLEPWLFRIAHNKCIDFLRRERRQREDTVSWDDETEAAADAREDTPDVDDVPVSQALAALVTRLPPRERACVLLKDVLDYSLAEIADMADTSVGGVKAALHRGREKLRRMPDATPASGLGHRDRDLLQSYVDIFNRRDWEALQQLIRADARIEVVGMSEFAADGAPYFGNYLKLPWEWKLSVERVDDEPVIVHWRRTGDTWVPATAVRLWWRDGKVIRIRDYVHADYLLANSQIL
jgi:RNA polymerase sigma-70 factor (ECF subfamily)